MASSLVTYHSSFNEECKSGSIKTANGVGICPLKTQFPGPATKITDDKKLDIIDEAL